MRKVAVLDASALLAVILSEPGSAAVEAVLDGSLLSTVNLTEAQTRLIRLGARPDHARSRILGMGCEIHPFTAELAFSAAELIAVTQPFGLSLGDRACLSLAIAEGATVYTADRTWKSLSLGIDVEVIR